MAFPLFCKPRNVLYNKISCRDLANIMRVGTEADLYFDGYTQRKILP